MTDQGEHQQPAFIAAIDGPRRPRVALMGEFSAGKSTLANLMIGLDPLPVQVVATQLPPVWISKGKTDPLRVDLYGEKHACDLTDIGSIQTDETAFIQYQCDAEILELCDLIDLPGLSDPNIASTVWERVLPLVDAVIWCSPSTQAWRQSEAAVWGTVDDEVKKNSMLLLTRADMIFSQSDKAKILKRVQRETKGMFDHVQLISLVEAAHASDDEGLWNSSGADEFVTTFMELIEKTASRLSSSSDAHIDATQGNGNYASNDADSRAPAASVADYTPKFS